MAIWRLGTTFGETEVNQRDQTGRFGEPDDGLRARAQRSISSSVGVVRRGGPTRGRERGVGVWRRGRRPPGRVRSVVLATGRELVAARGGTGKKTT